MGNASYWFCWDLGKRRTEPSKLPKFVPDTAVLFDELVVASDCCPVFLYPLVSLALCYFFFQCSLKGRKQVNVQSACLFQQVAVNRQICGFFWCGYVV